jgi:autotransporter passenger strand-loop-strand repeat protein
MTDALTAGSIAFTGFNADGDDSLAFVAFSDIKAGTVIHFTDNEWSGSAFASNENVWSWTATSDIAAGSIITMNGLGAGGTAASNLGTVVFDSANARDIADANEVVYAYTGDASAPVFLTAITNGSFATGGGRGTLTGTGLVNNQTAIVLISSADVGAYTGDRSSLTSIEEYKADIYKSSNWTRQGGTGDQSQDGTNPDLPFSTQAFTANPTSQRIEFASMTASVAEGDSGDTVLTLTLTRTGSTAGVASFSGYLDGFFGDGDSADGNDFGGSFPTFSGSFADGASTATVTIHISGDTTYEPDEMFTVNLDSASGTDGHAYVGSNSQVVATIVNDDPVQKLHFAAGSKTIALPEGNVGDTHTYTFVVERTGPTDGDLSFSGEVIPDSADAADFGGVPPGTFSGVIKAGESTATVTVTTTGDVDLEGSERFTLFLFSGSTSTGTAVVIDDNSATGIILNDEPLHVGAGETVTNSLGIGDGDHLVIDAGGTMAPTGSEAVDWLGGTSVLENHGHIAAQNPLLASQVTGALTIDNEQGGVMDGTIQVSSLGAGSSVTINNSGTLEKMNFSSIPAGATVVVNNLSGGLITTPTFGLLIRSNGNTTVNNDGRIISAQDVVDPSDGQPSLFGGGALDFGGGVGSSLDNRGWIEGAAHAVGGDGTLKVLNEASGVMIGRNGSAVNIDNNSSVAETVFVTNYGDMEGRSANYLDSDGDAVDVDGLAVIDNYGRIVGLGANGYHNGEANVSEGVAIGGGTINNYAGGLIYGLGRAIEIDDSSNAAAFAATTIYNEGVIRGDAHGPTGVSDEDAAAMNARIAGREAIDILGTFADSITNKGSINGGIFTDGGADTLDNSGIIAAIGGAAVDLGDNNDSLTNSGIIAGDVLLGAGDDTINLVTGSTISGIINGGDGNDTINLSGTGNGLLGKAIGVENVNVQGGDWRISSDASYRNVTVESGATLVVEGAVTTVTVAHGAGLYVYGTVADATVFGELGIGAGGAATGTTIGAGGEQNVVLGASASGTTVNGGSQFVAGTADDTTVNDAGIQLVFGNATDTTVNSGGEQNVYEAATATGTTLNAGGVQIDWGTAVATTITGGGQYVYGTAADTVILSGIQYVGAGGASYGTMIGSGGTAHAIAGSSVHNVTFAGTDATLVLDRASDFSGFISGWQDGNHLDVSDIAFAEGSTTLVYAANAGNSGGKLTVSDGTHTASLSLLGQYAASDFALSSDGHGGTMVSDPGVQVQNQLAMAHA